MAPKRRSMEIATSAAETQEVSSMGEKNATADPKRLRVEPSSSGSVIMNAGDTRAAAGTNEKKQETPKTLRVDSESSTDSAVAASATASPGFAFSSPKRIQYRLFLYAEEKKQEQQRLSETYESFPTTFEMFRMDCAAQYNKLMPTLTVTAAEIKIIPLNEETYSSGRDTQSPTAAGSGGGSGSGGGGGTTARASKYIDDYVTDHEKLVFITLGRYKSPGDTVARCFDSNE